MGIFSQFFKRFSNSAALQKGLFNVSTNKLKDPDLNWGSSDFMNAYRISLLVNKAINKRAEKVGEIDFVIRKKDGEIITEDPRLDILKNPNPQFTASQFWGLYQKYRDITGAAYIWIVPKERDLFEDRKVDSLVLLRSDLMRPAVDSTGRIIGFEFHNPNGTVIKFSPDEIIYLHNPDPLNQLAGESILRAGARAIDTENQIANYGSKVMRNGGKVEGVINLKTSGLSKEQLDDLKDKYDQQFAGSLKSGRPLFLGGEANYQKIALSPDELAYLESKKLNMNDILMLTGVPRTLLGSFEEIKFDNAKASLVIFLQETINPLLKELTRKLDARFFESDDDTLTFIDPTPEDQTAKNERLTTADAIHAMTTNEKRADIGLDPVSGGDDILIPFNLIPLNNSGSSDEEKKLKKKEKEFEHPLKDKDIREKYGNMMIKRMDRDEEKFNKILLEYFKKQKDRVINSLSDGTIKSWLDKKGVITKNAIDDAFNLELEIGIAKEELLPVMESILVEAGINAAEFGGSEFAFNLSGEIASWLDKKVDIFTRQINDTTFKKLQNEFATSLAENETRPQLIKRIENTYEDTITKAKATQIARTEVLGATQKGTFEGYKQALVPIKIWVTVGDAKVRDSHASQDGEERPINDPFTNGQQFPGDPTAGPAETINCRCSI